MTARKRPKRASATDQERVLDLLRSAAEENPLPDPINELREAVKKSVELQIQIKEAEDKLTDLKARRRHYTHEIIPQAMLEMGIVGDDNRGNVTVGGDYRVELHPRVFANVPAEKREEFHQWCKENGLADIVKESIHPKTLDATINGLLDVGNGGILPEYIKLFRQTEARIKAST